MKLFQLCVTPAYCFISSNRDYTCVYNMQCSLKWNSELALENVLYSTFATNIILKVRVIALILFLPKQYFKMPLNYDSKLIINQVNNNYQSDFEPKLQETAT